MSNKPTLQNESFFLPVRDTVNVDAHKGTIDLGNGWVLEDVPLVGKGSIIWRDTGDGAKSVDYEAMALRDAAGLGRTTHRLTWLPCAGWP